MRMLQTTLAIFLISFGSIATGSPTTWDELNMSFSSDIALLKSKLQIARNIKPTSANAVTLLTHDQCIDLRSKVEWAYHIPANYNWPQQDDFLNFDGGMVDRVNLDFLATEKYLRFCAGPTFLDVATPGLVKNFFGVEASYTMVTNSTYLGEYTIRILLDSNYRILERVVELTSGTAPMRIIEMSSVDAEGNTYKVIHHKYSYRYGNAQFISSNGAYIAEFDDNYTTYRFYRASQKDWKKLHVLPNWWEVWYSYGIGIADRPQQFEAIMFYTAPDGSERGLGLVVTKTAATPLTHYPATNLDLRLQKALFGHAPVNKF